MRSAPQSLLLVAISLIKAIVSGESLGFLAHTFDLRFQNRRKSSRCQRSSVVFLDKEKGLFPGSDHPGEEHQKKPIRLSVGRSFDLSTQNDQWHASERIFRQPFRFPSGQIDERVEHKGDCRWFDPT